MPCPRTGSMAKKPTSAFSCVTSSTDLPAASTGINFKGNFNWAAKARAKSTDTPTGSPCASLRAKMGLPRLMTARKVPVGARSAGVMSVAGWAQALV